MRKSPCIPEKLLVKYSFFNYNHALEILSQAYPTEWQEILSCLSQFSITTADLSSASGNESNIPKKFDDILYPLGWREIRISGDLHVHVYPRNPKRKGRFLDIPDPDKEKILNGYIDGHSIDFLKNRVAFDLEWNSKDQTFDRDLMAMRTYQECDIISVGIIVTRDNDLNEVFDTIYDHTGKSIKRKYGASTTWIGKLNYRLESRRNGACPILAVGIKRGCISDWKGGK